MTKKNAKKQAVYKERSKKNLKDVGLQDVGIDGDPAKRPPNRPKAEASETKKNVKKQAHYKKEGKARLAVVGLKSFSVDPAREGFGEVGPLEDVKLEDE